MHNKLIFPLCRSCAETLTNAECRHDDPNERVLYGTWVSEEVKKAVELGYVIKKIYEIYQYKSTQFDEKTGKGGLFSGYINKFFCEKTQASGYPPDCVTDEDKDQYVKNIEKYECISLDRDKIEYNPGHRSVVKLCLNSLWGKFGQRDNMQKTEVVTEPARLVELLNNPGIEVNGVLPVNENTLYVNWSSTDDACQPSPNTNVVIAAFTSAQARLKLFGYLHQLGSRAAYFDTDSVFAITRPGDTSLPTGQMLGDLTDELACMGVGTHITSFISAGAKFYSYKYRKPNGEEGYVNKIKGVRLNYANSKKINYESVLSMINGETNNITVSNVAIRRTNFHDVISVNEKKICKPVYTKRRYIGLGESYPFGYRQDK